MAEPLKIARIVSAHGIKGEVRLTLFLDNPASLHDFGPVTDGTGKVYDIKLLGPAKAHWRARIGGISDRDAAEAIKGTDLFIDRANRPEPDEDEFYFDDLIGLVVCGLPQAVGASVLAMHDFGAGIVMEIAYSSDDVSEKQTVMIPFTKAAVPHIDLQSGTVTIVPPDGLLDPPDHKSGNE